MKFGMAFANVGPFVEPENATFFAKACEERGIESLGLANVRVLANRDDVLTVMIHSNGHRAGDLDGIQLGKMIRDAGFNGVRVELVACNAGRGRLARDLAGGLCPGSVVAAPMGWVTVTADSGYPFVALHRPIGDAGWQYASYGVGWIRYAHMRRVAQ